MVLKILWEKLKKFHYWMMGIEIVDDEEQKEPEIKELDRVYHSPSQCPFKVFTPVRLFQEMHYYIANCPIEMGTHIETEKVDDSIYLRSLPIPEQTNTGSSYKPSSKYLAEIARTNPRLLSRVRGWFHSHVDFGVYWSPDDEQTIRNNIGVFDDYCLSIVGNKQGEFRVRLDIKGDKVIDVYDEIPLRIWFEDDYELEQKCINEIHAKVKHDTTFNRVWGYIKHQVNKYVGY